MAIPLIFCLGCARYWFPPGIRLKQIRDFEELSVSLEARNGFSSKGVGPIEIVKSQVPRNWWFGLVVWGLEPLVLVEGKGKKPPIQTTNWGKADFVAFKETPETTSLKILKPLLWGLVEGKLKGTIGRCFCEALLFSAGSSGPGWVSRSVDWLGWDGLG